jgi:undecaprenyl-diphosphatase
VSVLPAALGFAALLVLDPHLSMMILAVVQGLTEFLPISSSGHLVLGQRLLGMGQSSLVEDVVLHLGTLLAVVFFYRRDIARLLRDVARRGPEGSRARAYALALIVGTLPAAAVGLFLEDPIERIFDRVELVLAAMTATALLLFLTRRFERGEGQVTLRAALLIGVAQAVAILPGCSRSGWTISVALALGIGPVEAARFSFLLSVPAILGAVVLQAGKLEAATTPVSALLLGAALAAVVGFLALRWLLALLRDMRLHRFAWYLLGLVATGLLFSLI